MFLSPGMVGVLSDRDRVSSISDSVAHSSDHGSASKKVYLSNFSHSKQYDFSQRFHFLSSVLWLF